MKNIPVLFSQEEITKFIEPIKSIKDRTDFFNFQLKIYEKAYKLVSDKDIAKYISKYNLKNIVESNNNNSPHAINTLVLDMENEHENFKYNSIKYSRLQFEISQLAVFVKNHLTNLDIVNSIINNDFAFLFKKSTFEHELYSLKDDNETLLWLNGLHIRIVKMYSNFDDFYFDKLYEKYNLEKLFPINKQKVSINDCSISPKYSVFKNHLQIKLIPSIEEYKNDLKFAVLVNEAIKKHPDNFKDDNEKFPILDFHYESIHRYCENVFSETEDKIDYFCHILKVYNRLVALKDIIPDNAHDSIPHIKTELKLLKISFKMEKSRKQESNNLIVSNHKDLKVHQKPKVSIGKKNTVRRKIINRDKLLWLGTKEQLVKLLKSLQSFDFLENQIEQDPECEKLLIYFTDQNNDDYINKKFTKKIKWKKLNADLIYLYSKLTRGKTKLLDDDHLWIKTEKIFLNRFGRIMKHKNLSVSFDRLSGKERSKLDEIVSGIY